MDELKKLRTKVKMTIPESNWNFFSLDLQKRMFKVMKKFVTKINNHLNRLKNKIFLCKRKEHKVALFDQSLNGTCCYFGLFFLDLLMSGLEKYCVLHLLTLNTVF